MNKNIFFIILLTMASAKSSLLKKVKSTLRSHMLTKKEMISGFCLAPLSLYAGLQTKEHLKIVNQDAKKEELSKSLKKMLGWAVAGGLCNYTIYQNIKHLLKKIPLQKKKMLVSSIAHSALILVYALCSQNRPPNNPKDSSQEKAEYIPQEKFEYKNQFSLYNIIIMGLAFIIALKIIELKIKNMSFQLSLLLHSFYFFTFPTKKNFSRKEKRTMKKLAVE